MLIRVVSHRLTRRPPLLVSMKEFEHLEHAPDRRALQPVRKSFYNLIAECWILQRTHRFTEDEFARCIENVLPFINRAVLYV